MDLNNDIKLYKGDCLEIMKDIPDKSIDMILCDLPYGTTDCKWDVIIPFEPLWEQYHRIIKDNGAIVLTSTQPFTTKLIQSNMKNFKYTWYWKKSKPTGFQHAKNKPLNIIEDILVFSKGSMGHKSLLGDKRLVYNPQGLIECKKIVKGAKGKFGGTVGSKPSHKDEYIAEYKNYPNNFLEFPSIGKNVHPTQKPVPLLEYLIKTYTNENEIVLDNCMGSGSTGVACVNTNRKFIGIELDDKYFEIAKNRIEDTYKNI